MNCDHYICLTCRKMVDAKVIHKEETYTCRGKDITVDSRIPICVNCGRELWDNEMSDETIRKVYEKRSAMDEENQRMIYRTYKDALFDLTEFKGRLIYDAAGNTFKGKMFQPEYDSLELAIDVLRNLVQKEQKEEG